MEHKFPCPIKCDNDLNYYADYIEKCSGKASETLQPRNDRGEALQMTVENSAMRGDNTLQRLTDGAFMPAYLKAMTGKLVRVESLIGNCLESRIGILLSVGADYIVLKLYRSCSTMICESSSIKYITVIHDNDINKSGLL